MYGRALICIIIPAVIMVMGTSPGTTADKDNVEPVIARLHKEGAGLQPARISSFSASENGNNDTLVFSTTGTFVFTITETLVENITNVEIFMYPVEQDTYEFPVLRTGLIQAMETGSAGESVLRISIKVKPERFEYRYRRDAKRLMLTLNSLENHAD